jgi:hypothetical protein
MGLHGLNNPAGTANPKAIIAQLKSDYTGTYAGRATRVTLAARTPAKHTAQLVAAVDAPGPVNPTGTVRFFNGSTFLGSARVVHGVARLRVPLSPGKHRLEAVFEGERRFHWSFDKLRVRT